MRSVALLALALLGGCQEPAAPATTATNSATASATATPLPPPASAPTATGKAIVDAEGVAFGPSASTVRRLAFGTAQNLAVAAAEGVFKAPAVRSTNVECGAGPMEFARFGGLTLNFLDDELVGWFAVSDPIVVTSDGIRPGTLFRDLKVARSAALIEGTTLDGEFEYVAADGKTIGGFVSGEARDARIESLYAGTTCFFR